MLHTIERFNQQAVKHNLSAGAILLWQHLFFTMERKKQFADVYQNTAALIAQLEITRQGLQMMRQNLVNKGFLDVRVDEHQQIFYTLMIDGKVVGEKQEKEYTKSMDTTVETGLVCPSAPVPFSKMMDNTNYINGKGNPSPTDLTVDKVRNIVQMDKESYPSGDIILNGKFRPYMDTFCETFGPAVRADLLSWAEMRRKNGWTLTLMGLEVELKKLIKLSEGDVFQMAKIAAQSVKRRWKSFWPLYVKANPSGAKLLAMEEAENGSGNVQKSTSGGYGKPWQKSAPEPKFKPEGRDLSFLEF